MKKKSINKIILIVLGLILVLSFININIFNHMDYCLDKNNQCLRENLELSDYSSFIEGEGEDINITLHQSLLNTSIITISNISDPTKNNIYEPCPTVENFNSSLVNITIEDIYAPNATLLIEVDSSNSNLQDFTSNPTATSFKVEGDGYLENVFVYCREENGLFSTTVSVYLYNSTWNSITKKSEPDIFSMLLLDTFTIPAGETFTWYNVSHQHEFLDNLKTENNTWFIGLTDGGSGDGRWYYLDDYDSGFPTDNDNETRSYQFNGLTWDLISNPLSGCNSVDLKLKVELSPYIYPSNITVIFEDGPDSNNQQFDDVSPVASSFKVKGNGYLEKVSTELYNPNSPDNVTVRFVLYNSTWNSTGVSIPYGFKNDYVADLGTINYSANLEWVTLTGLQEYLDNSKTENNTWFIGLFTTIDSAYEGYWEFNWISQGNGLDDTRSYRYQTFPSSKWILTELLGQKVDYHLKIDLSPVENIPKPENIGLRINDIPVIGYNNLYGSGYWISIKEYSNLSGYLEFELSADWWDVSCKITKVQINYTKTDLKASSKFTILESGQDVQWNVTRSGGLNFFDPRITHHSTINFTIPATWLNINTFNGPENKTSDIKTRLLNNGYHDVEIIDATNGTFWYLTATSKNLVESIDIYTGSNPISMVNYSDVVEFNVTFNKIIGQNDGIINLCVYSPAAINDKLNFTSVNSTFDSGSEFYLGKWDLSDTVMEYGEFRVQVFWNNDTAAGFIEKILTVMGQTDLTLIAPNQDATYYSNQSFNIVFYYKDSNQLEAIDGATIQYNINGHGWQSTSSNNGTIGYYIIPVNCSIFTIEGTKAVEITATKNYYESQTLNYNFNVNIVEEKGKPAKGIPLVIIIIAIVSTAGGTGVATVTIVLLRKRKRANAVI